MNALEYVTLKPMFAANPTLFDSQTPVEDILLRDYQNESIEGLRDNIRNGIDSQILAAFVGAGKTVMAAYLLREAFRKGCRGYFVVDRLSLLGQTSAMFDRYGIPHGVVQSKHPRNFPDEQIQIASIQTVASRGWNKSDVIFYDECHVIYKTVTDRILMGGAKMIGLSATPFTRGLGRYYKAIVNVRTGNQLTADGFLVPFRVFAANEPDMKGVKTVAGEWVEGETSDRAKVIIGDVVKEFLQHAGARKGIAFGVDVSHCEEMRKQFAAAGVVTALYTYMTPDDEREEMLREFRKPDSKIRLLISVSALSRGFDVPSVEVIIMCRPLKSSFAEFVQIIGRGLRSHPSKKDCIILDLAGNFMRHYGELVDFMENGWHELDDGKKKEKDDKKPEPRKTVKCTECFYVFNGGKTCPNCGHVIERMFARSKTDIIHQDGELGEFDLSTKRITKTPDVYFGHILRRPDIGQPASNGAIWFLRNLGYRGPTKLTKQKCYLITQEFKKAQTKKLT
jgi:superfamily II DNA or RNA helicase